MMKTIESKSSRTTNLKPLFEPRAVAVIGASRRPEAVGYAVLRNLTAGGFKGAIYPVNPKADVLGGLTCYRGVDDLPEDTDLAVIIVAAELVNETLRSCGAKGIKAAIIITAGFREVGAEGKKIEVEAIEIAKQYGIRLLGPNCLGMINTDLEISINASFAREMPKPGNIAFISQSGALCTAILDYAKGENIGFSKFVSLGNKADITELDVLRYLKEDPKTDLIMMYLEDLVNGREFIEVARDITGDLARTKPILAIKAGRTAQGAKAASSHTGSLMGSDEVYDAIFAQAGVMRVDSVQEMFTLAVAFANQPLPKGKRVAIVTNAGGPGIMTTDACVRHGLEMAEFDPKTVEALSKVLPPTANLSNPVDVIGDARHERYEEAIRLTLEDPHVNGVIVILTPQAMTDIEEIAQAIVKLGKETKIPLLACFMGIVDVSAGVKILEENKIPHYRFPEDAARAMAAMYRYTQWTARPRTTEKKYPVEREKVQTILAQAKAQGQKMLPIHLSMEVFRLYGFPTMPFAFAKNEAEAEKAAKKIGFPAVIKIICPDVVHKVDLGGIRLNLKSGSEVRKAAREMIKEIKKKLPGTNIEGLFVQKMSPKGREVILGMNRDMHFGPILMFGLGGIYVEALKDVTFRLAPIRELGAKRMIESIRGLPILKGVRQENPADLNVIAECLGRLSQLACEQPAIAEMDLNPIIVYDKGMGAAVVDARIILKK